MYTRKRRSFKVTPGKLEELWERLVEMRGTPKKGGETPEKRGEPKDLPGNQQVEEVFGCFRHTCDSGAGLLYHWIAGTTI